MGNLFLFLLSLGHSFIANILLFLFVYQWVKTEDYKYLFYIFVVTVLACLEQNLNFGFYCISVYICLSRFSHILLFRQILSFCQVVFSVNVIYGYRVFTHLWQLNLLSWSMSVSDRTVESSLLNLFSQKCTATFFERIRI